MQKRFAVVTLALWSFLTARTSEAAAQPPPGRASVHAPEPFEGFWARTKKECLDDEDGPNSRTMIDLNNTVDGKPTPIFDQYENHCLVEGRTNSAKDTTLSVTCYEFWEEFTKRVEGRQATIKLTAVRKERLIIDGISYRRCDVRPRASKRTP